MPLVLFANATLSTFTTPDFILFLGRFHPSLVHLPIGFLLMAVLLELFSRTPRFATLQDATTFALLCTAVSSVVAGTLGYCLSLEGGYEANLLARHQWSGIALTMSTIVLALLKLKPELLQEKYRARAYNASLAAACSLLILAGHQGGALTHGSDYLTYYWPRSATNARVAQPNNALVYEAFIQPIFAARCVSCHNAEKRKGELVLENAQGLRQGGKHGAIVLASNVAGSELLRRLTLPAEHEERMPPSGKEALRAEEIELLRRWVQAGAAFDLKVAQFDLPEGLSNGKKEDAFAMNVSPADTSALGALRRAGVIVTPIARAQNFLQASVTNLAATFDDKQLALFLPLAEQLAWLDLHNTKITDAGLVQVAQLKQLTRLRLENTQVSDAGLAQLQNLSQLEYLNLYGTKVSDAGLQYLAGLKKLQSLYLWQTQASAAGIAALQSSLPNLNANLGVTLANIDASSMQLAPPAIYFSNSFLTKPETVTLESSLREVAIHYTLDGSTPTTSSPRYTKPLVISNSTTLQAVTFKAGWKESAAAVAEFVKLQTRIANVKLKTPPSARYAGHGPSTLIDMKKASTNFDDGMWLGFEHDDLEAQLDLGGSKPLRKISVSCLEDMNSWIFFPTAVEFFVSQDGAQYQSVGSVKYGIPQRDTQATARFFSTPVQNVAARYVKVKIKNVGLCPAWHKGAGGKAWLFADEIVVE